MREKNPILTKSFLFMVFSGFTLLMTSGCGIGYRTVVFVTQTNAGVDLDTQPPAVDINISRKEAVIEPQFEDGKTLPVMASFRSKTLGVLRPFTGVSTSFATGRAAAVMSRLLNDKTLPEWKTGDSKENIENDPNKEKSELSSFQLSKVKNTQVFNQINEDMDGSINSKRDKEILEGIYNGVKINEKPWRQGFWSFLPFLPKKDAVFKAEKKENKPFSDKFNYRRKRSIDFMEKGEVRPVVFNTDSNLGLKVQWNSSAGQYPSSFKFGFNRKELAYTPVTLSVNYDDNDDELYKVNIASLLATTGTEVNAGKSQETGLKHLQYFATGAAADNLSMREEVREVFRELMEPKDFPRDLEFDFKPVIPYYVKEKRDRALHLVKEARESEDNEDDDTRIRFAAETVWDIDENEKIELKDIEGLINQVPNEIALDKLKDFLRLADEGNPN